MSTVERVLAYGLILLLLLQDELPVIVPGWVP